jgi:hypothetical protein
MGASMSAGIFITRDELDATRGLSDLAVRLYWRLRSLMDFSTCIVGKHRRISYQSLREDCEVLTPKGQGFMRTQPTLRGLRTALDGLERAGLVESAGPLVFHLARAQKSEVRPNQTRHEPGTVAIAANPYAASDSGQTRQKESVERGTPLRFKEKHVYKTAAGAHGSVDNSGDIAAAFLKNLVSKTGCPIAGKATDAAVGRLLALPEETVLAATAQAVAARKRDGSVAPLNPGFIARFVEQTDWRATWSGIVAKGKELGIEQQAGEMVPYFKHRVMLAAGEGVAA